MTFEILIYVLIAIAFFVFGNLWSDSSWRYNSKVPARILSDGAFYKVVKLGDKTSESYAKLHLED